jgi:hypothetical protein
VRRAWTVVLAGAIAASAPPLAGGSDATLERTFVRGIAQLRAASAPQRLDTALRRTLQRLREDRGSTPTGRRGRSLAVAGFMWMRRRVQAELAMQMNDSGNVEAATRDAQWADRCLARGAALLRAAGRQFGIRVGTIDGR